MASKGLRPREEMRLARKVRESQPDEGGKGWRVLHQLAPWLQQRQWKAWYGKNAHVSSLQK